MLSFTPINPILIAKKNRSRMMISEDGIRKYYVAKLEGSEQFGEVLEKYFRKKEYIKERSGLSTYMKEWLRTSVEEVWSSKFLGIDQKGLQKLEFQNPPYDAAYRLGGDPREYNLAFVVQLNGCDYECAFCFVPKTINNPSFMRGKYFSASKIIDVFQKISDLRKQEGKGAIKTIRLTGGEVTTIVPELIIDIWRELEKRQLTNDIYLWVDCNLSTNKFLEERQEELKSVFKQANVGIVGCLKTIGDGELGKEDFSLITKAHAKYYEMQFEVLEYIVKNLKANLFVYLVPIMTGNIEHIRLRINSCIKRLRRIDPNLPLRANITYIHPYYSPASKNLQTAQKEGRILPKTDERLIWHIWHNEILPEIYSKEQLSRYMCQVPFKRDWESNFNSEP